jgi:methylated-DNA-[protein]-cysteine S-methyltransferase
MRVTVLGRRGEKKKTPVALSYARYDSPVGPLMAVAGGKAVLAISFVDNHDDLKGPLAASLGTGFSLYEDTRALAPLFRLLDEYFSGHAVDFSSIEARPSGTAFDQKVWKALRAIPSGEVRSYAEVATAIGSPRAFRAVAGACARNRLPIIIPCHRVVRSDGGLGGWSGGGGPGVKKMLLAIEEPGQTRQKS